MIISFSIHSAKDFKKTDSRSLLWRRSRKKVGVKPLSVPENLSRFHALQKLRLRKARDGGKGVSVQKRDVTNCFPAPRRRRRRIRRLCRRKGCHFDGRRCAAMETIGNPGVRTPTADKNHPILPEHGTSPIWGTVQTAGRAGMPGISAPNMQSAVELFRFC